MESRIKFLVGIAERAKGISEYEPQIISQLKGEFSEDDLIDFHSLLSEEISFVGNYADLSEADILIMYGLFNWLANQLLNDENMSPVPILLVLHVSVELDFGMDQLWKELASVGSLREDRLRELKKLLLTRKFEIEWFRRDRFGLAKRFEDCCAKHDWQELDSLLRHVVGYLYDVPLSRAARALSVFSMSTLEDTLNQIEDIASLIIVIESIFPLQALKTHQIAVSSNSWPLKFCVLNLSFEYNKNYNQIDFEDFWTELLIQASQNNKEWKKWAAVFNTYPSRYPSLQKAMAKALCKMSSNALRRYFEVIKMRSNGRTELLETFKFIKEHCNKRQRKKIWSLAFERWQSWSFDVEYLFSLEGSPLDIAVVEFFKECLTDEQRIQQDKKFRSDFINIHNTWYESLSGYITAYNRHLSLYQPLAHSIYKQCNDGDWEQGSCWYHPDWAPNTPYWKIKIRD